MYYLMLNMYNIQEVYFISLICKVYVFICVSVLLLLNSGQDVESNAPVGLLLACFIKWFCFPPKGQTDLTTVSEIGIVIVHFVYWRIKLVFCNLQFPFQCLFIISYQKSDRFYQFKTFKDTKCLRIPFIK